MDSSREQLLHLLAEAAELEHNILCSYLYAAFSLKERLNEGLTVAEMQVVGTWKEQLMSLCVEEMAHLAQVSNLFVAAGSRPHFNRPNLPTPPGYHPAGIDLGLSPLDMETLDHFIFLERPEGAPVEDATPFAKPAGSVSRPKPAFEPLMPRAPHYDTIGEFYAELGNQMEDAAKRLGMERLFCGGADCQISGVEIGVSGLVVVTDLEGARQALAHIVHQGEGSSGLRDESHYGKFKAIKSEYEKLIAIRPAFTPHRDAARNPVMHAPVENGRVYIDGARAAPVLDAANAAYALMLRCLAKVYETPRSASPLRSALLQGAMASMKVVAALGCELAQLPARDTGGERAGISFAMLRSTEGPASGADARLIGERVLEVARRLPQLAIKAELPLVKALLAVASALQKSD